MNVHLFCMQALFSGLIMVVIFAHLFRLVSFSPHAQACISFVKLIAYSTMSFSVHIEIVLLNISSFCQQSSISISHSKLSNLFWQIQGKLNQIIVTRLSQDQMGWLAGSLVNQGALPMLACAECPWAGYSLDHIRGRLFCFACLLISTLALHGHESLAR